MRAILHSDDLPDGDTECPIRLTLLTALHCCFLCQALKLPCSKPHALTRAPASGGISNRITIALPYASSTCTNVRFTNADGFPG